MFEFITDRFLTMHLSSKEGVTHFKRWCLFHSERGNLYLHKICRSDADRHPHNHPWNFKSLILWGGYIERIWENGQLFMTVCEPGMLLRRSAYEFHQIQLFEEAKPTWTLVWVGPRINDPWGYLVGYETVDHVSYRKRKNTGAL